MLHDPTRSVLFSGIPSWVLDIMKTVLKKLLVSSKINAVLESVAFKKRWSYVLRIDNS